MKTLNKILTLQIIILFISNHGFSQTAVANFNKLKVYYEKHTIGVKNPNVRLNKAENILEFSGINIPLFETKVLYKLIDNENAVVFECDDCIIGDNGKLTGTGFRFKTKDECYIFINLISDLRSVLKK